MSLIGFKLFIGNLSKETHDTGLEKYFKDAIGGEIVWAQVGIGAGRLRERHREGTCVGGEDMEGLDRRNSPTSRSFLFSPRQPSNSYLLRFARTETQAKVNGMASSPLKTRLTGSG